MSATVTFVHTTSPDGSQREAVERAVLDALTGRTGAWVVSLETGDREQRWLITLQGPSRVKQTWTFETGAREPSIVRATLERDLADRALPMGWQTRDHDEGGDLEAIEEDIACATRALGSALITGRDAEERLRIARILHRRSGGAAAPFVSINCAAPPKPLLAADLFGDHGGSFAGTDRSGAIARVRGGTMFLDEIGELSQPLQAFLNQLLAEGRAHSGATTGVRVIAASSRSLFERVLAREFREDLFYRLNVIHIHIRASRQT